MKINSIKLINFRQYKNVELEFAYDLDRNVTIILGDNGFGKTTLVRSFLWCLYRDNYFKNKNLLNLDVALTMNENDEKTVKVELEIEHADIIYTITTQESYKRVFDENGNPVFDELLNPVLTVSKKAYTKIIKTTDDETMPVASTEIKNEIESILRKELSSFLFYDGENNKIENSTQSRKIDMAVYEFMGIQKIMNLQTQLDPHTKNTVISKLRDSLKSDDELSSAILRQERDELLSKKSKNLETIKNNENEIANLNEQWLEKEAILDSNTDVYEDQKEKKALDKKIKDNQALVCDKFHSMVSIVNGPKNNLLKSLFAYCYNKNDMGTLQDKSSFSSDNSLSHISEEVVDELIARGRCLCGTPITSESEALQHLIESKNHMEPHDFGKYLSDFCTSEETNVELVKTSQDEVVEACDKFLSYVEEIENAKERVATLKTKIEGRPDIGIVQTQANNIKSQITGLEATNKYINNNVIPEIEDALEKNNKKIEEVASDNEENTLINRCIVYAQAIYRRTFLRIENSKKELKNLLEKNTNEIFGAMYHGDRQITLNDRFQMITTTNNYGIDNSTGIETVKNFAFVTALMKTLKEKVFDINDNSSNQNESYPLVIDAPFSNTDDTHIRNICATLPKYCNQLIIVVMKKDFEIAKDSLADRIDSIYEIVNHSDTFDTIEEMK